MYSTKSIEILRREKKMWNPGDIVTWRGIYRERIWHAQPTIAVKDTLDEIILALLPGTECIAPEDYVKGKQNGKRRWNFKDKDWVLERYLWRTNRLLFLLEPEKYYSTILFWNDDRNELLCYYINFQIPYRKSHYGIDTLDLDLDLIINLDFSFEWKDEDDYRTAIDHGIISPEQTRQIELAGEEIFERLEKRQYPFDGSWLDWMPDPSWLPPKLPENWDKI
jgi:predicted RNA-binding protein associated with RNAse of E/G family